MSLLAGCVTKNGTVSRTEIERKLRTYSILTEDDLSEYENLAIETRCGYLLQKYKKHDHIRFQPHRDADGNTFLPLGLLFTPQQSGWAVSPTQLEQCEGEFVAVLAEASGTLHIINDRFGSRPFYVLKNGKGLYFSSNVAFLLHLAGGRHEADILGWFHTFAYGHTFGELTTFRGVKRLAPATHLTISPEGAIEERRYWRLEYAPESRLDALSYSAKVFEAFKTGAARKAKLVGKGIVALSGGLDSRLVAATIPNDVEFSAFTFVNAGDSASTADTECATQICSILGLPHRIEPIPRQEYSIVADDTVRLTGGMKPLHHSAIVMAYIQDLKRHGLNFLLGGGPGDVIAGSKIPSVNYLDARKMDEYIQDFCRRLAGGTEYLSLLFRQEIVKQYQREVYRSLLESFADIRGPTAAHRVTAWELLNRWPAFTFTSVFHNHPDVSEAFCHLDYKFVDMMLKLPAEWLYQRNFYSFMIYNCLPQLRHVAYANTGRPLSGELQHFDYSQDVRTHTVNSAYHVARQVILRKLRRLLQPIPRATPPFYWYLYQEDKKLLEDMQEGLHSLPALRAIVDADKCLRFLNGFRAGNMKGLPYGKQTELIGALATMCLSFKWLMNQS
jgi:Glutamine amidotransferase domain/Asparagine synthase